MALRNPVLFFLTLVLMIVISASIALTETNSKNDRNAEQCKSEEPRDVSYSISNVFGNK